MTDSRPGVLFDVDGTLVDTNYLHTVSWARAFADAGEWAPMNAIHRLVGMGSDQLVGRLLGHDSAAAADAHKRRFKEMIDDVRVFPGAADLLARAHDSGLAVVLATSSPADDLETFEKLLDAGDAIDARTTADDVEQSKPAPDVFLAALEAGSIDRERALVLGDSVWDVQAAQAAGLGCVAVETGGFSRHELFEAGALQVYRDVAEVLAQFRTGPLGRLL
jgi:HAD superfamily hydrolase (TIGR01509 family)